VQCISLARLIKGMLFITSQFWWAAGSVLGAGLAIFIMVPGGLGWHWYLGLSTIPLFVSLSLFLVSE